MAFTFVYACFLLFGPKVLPRSASEPPVIFHWLPIIGSAISYGNDPLNFFFSAREKVILFQTFSLAASPDIILFKYGDVFTFILLGRRVTVALGPKGNNFVLGGKSTVLNAEDAYTVTLHRSCLF